MAECKHDGPKRRVVYEEPGEPTIGPYVIVREYCKLCGQEIPYVDRRYRMSTQNAADPESSCGGRCGFCDEKHRDWEAKVETAEAAARTLQTRVTDLEAELEAMTEDRDLWQGDHNETCPNVPEKCCSVCAEPTETACSDCRIDFGVTIYVCAKDRAEHEKKCSARLRVRIDHALVDMTARLKRLNQLRITFRDQELAAGCARAMAELTAVRTLLGSSYGVEQYPNIRSLAQRLGGELLSNVTGREEHGPPIRVTYFIGTLDGTELTQHFEDLSQLDSYCRQLTSLLLFGSAESQGSEVHNQEAEEMKENDA